MTYTASIGHGEYDIQADHQLEAAREIVSTIVVREPFVIQGAGDHWQFTKTGRTVVPEWARR